MSLLLQPVDLLHADADLKPLIDLAARVQQQAPGELRLIVIDTLSRAMAGGDENISTDMGVMVKHLDALRSVAGSHVLVVHHSGKRRESGARGHSLLRAATDTEIEIADRNISVTKQRDLEGNWSSPFALDVVPIGVDADNRPASSCVVRLLPKGAAETGGQIGVETLALDAIGRAWDAGQPYAMKGRRSEARPWAAKAQERLARTIGIPVAEAAALLARLLTERIVEEVTHNAKTHQKGLRIVKSGAFREQIEDGDGGSDVFG